jgi:hypothetical protein
MFHKFLSNQIVFGIKPSAYNQIFHLFNKSKEIDWNVYFLADFFSFRSKICPVRPIGASNWNRNVMAKFSWSNVASLRPLYYILLRICDQIGWTTRLPGALPQPLLY